ncbi:Uncharacterised protein [Brucella suis]|nr:Uncharacterised protein [Brucella suis]
MARNLLFKRRGHESRTIGPFASRCQQMAICIEHRDGRRIERGNGSGDQLADGLGRFSGKSAFGTNNDRGRRLLVAAAERAFFGQNDVNARSLHAANGLNGTGNFSFERAHTGNLLHKGRKPQRPHIVEQLITGIVRGRQALFGQIHAGVFGLADWNEDRGSIRLHVEGNASFTERKAHAVHVIARKADIERLVGWATQIDARIEDRTHQSRAYKAERDELSRTKLAERSLELFDQLLEILLHPHHRHPVERKLMREACAKVAMRMRCGLPDRMSGRMSGKKKNGRGIHSAPVLPA